jgi:uncharacterized membrane protein YcaP (DUF421 family)
MGMHISWLFLTLSAITTFAILLLLVRWIGSTQLTQLTFFNWVAGASMGNVAANMLSTTDVKTWVGNCYSLIVFTAVSIAAANIALKSRTFRGVTTGEPIVLVHKGVILRENLRKTKVNLDVFMMLLREKGYFSYNDIEFAILEPTGNLSILPTPASQSVSKIDLVKGPDLSEQGQGPYVELVVDGEIDEDKLKSIGHTKQWLLDKIRELGAHGIEDVTYLAMNEQGEMISDLNRKKEPSDEEPTV